MLIRLDDGSFINPDHIVAIWKCELKKFGLQMIGDMPDSLFKRPITNNDVARILEAVNDNGGR